MLSYPMPFRAVPCSIWLVQWGEKDAYGNQQKSYHTAADINTVCCYAFGSTQRASTSDDIEENRPHGTREVMTFYLPKTVNADLRDALIAPYPSDDETLNARRFKVVGVPYSYPRPNTPGDYSWAVEAVAYRG